MPVPTPSTSPTPALPATRARAESNCQPTLTGPHNVTICAHDRLRRRAHLAAPIGGYVRVQEDASHLAIGSAMGTSGCMNQPVAQRLPVEHWWGAKAANVGFSAAEWGDRASHEARWAPGWRSFSSGSVYATGWNIRACLGPAMSASNSSCASVLNVEASC